MKKSDISDPNKRGWYDMALHYGQAHKSFCQIWSEDQIKTWSAYFWEKGWQPWNFGPGWTAPCAWPQELPA